MSGRGVSIVAIDGPSGVGKSTVARLLGERLGLPVLDTGAMYRALGLKVLLAGADPDDRGAVGEIAERTSVDLRRADGDRLEAWLDGEPVGDRIRTPEVSAATSRISAYPEIRRRMVERQRRVAERRGAVVEGRDIGTVVFPSTPYKFFLSAAPEVRAERRVRELEARGRPVDRERLHREIAERDRRDSGRDVSPLSYDDTYVLIDTSELSPEAIVERMLEEIARRGASTGD